MIWMKFDKCSNKLRMALTLLKKNLLKQKNTTVKFLKIQI